MTTVNLTEIELNEFVGKEDKNQHCKATFPLIGAHGSKKLATVYFELEPGDHLGRHTDSAEELLVILDGTVEALVGTEKQKAEKGALVLVPEMVPHDFKNIGATTAKILGVFGGANNIVATFDNEMLPTESNVVDTSLLFS
ncbi:cupin domain-containing protein [Muricauda sp. MAR_2010_75]|jgi:quercetin dioxygenase-like cupin family protein|uniref:cupin domain-containing protein n=1 Tax=Allomuricauda sp. MAR_2010_75 TaxID=1250232 RepID=UPI00068E6ACB|nr:cupin domain-containing protein [Muricauda sp. MAR_2010_75]